MLINGKLINFRALLVRWEIAFYGPLLVFAPFTLQAAILADTVSWNVIGREVQIFNPHFSSVGGEGQGEGIIHGNSAIVTGGAFVGVAGNYHIQENDTSYCPGCIIQLYTAWIAPAPAGSQAFYNGGIPPGFGTQIGVIPNNFADSALYAPTEPGVYYIGFAFTLQYQIFPNRQGVFGTLPGGSVANYAPFRVTVIGESLPDNPQGNTLNLASGGGYGILSDYTNRGTLNNAGATLVVPGLTNFTNAGVFNNSGNVQIFGSFTNAGNLKISGGAMADGAIDELEPGGFVQMAGSTTITGGGTLSTNHLDLRTGDLNLVDGNLTVGHFDNQGNFNYSGGSFQGELNNLGTVNVSGSGTRIFNGNVTNQGTFKITDTQVQFNGTFTNSGAYISDPSTNQFNNLVVGPEGYLVGGSGDTFIITGDFLNASTQSTLWNTTKAELIFAESELGNSEHILQLAGEDRGAQAAGFLNNFAWGSLTLNPGQTLILQDGNNTAGAALYVRTINLPGGMAQLAGISGDYNIYFDPTVEANQAFLNGASFGSGSGQLLPWSFVPDLVETEGLTLDQQNFSAALDEACLNPSEALGLRCAELQSMTPEQKQQAIQSLTPDQVPNQAGIPVKFNSTRMDAVFTRLTGLRRGTTPAFSLNLNGLQFSKNLLLKANEDAGSPLRDSPLGMFIQSRFNIGGVNGNAFERGSDFETRNVTFGMDYRFTDNLVAGVAVNYTNTSSRYHWGAGSLDSDTFLGSFYGGYYLPQDFYVDWLASYGGTDYTFNRRFRYPGFAGHTHATPSGDQFTIALSGGRDFNFGAWQISPQVRFEYLNLHIDAYQEKGGSGLALSVGGQLNHSLVSDVGLQVSRVFSTPFGVITPSIRVEWEHQYLNDNRPIAMRLSNTSSNLGNFAIYTGKPDRDYVNLGGSLSLALQEGNGLYLRYESRLGQSNLDQHIVEGGVKISF